MNDIKYAILALAGAVCGYKFYDPTTRNQPNDVALETAARIAILEHYIVKYTAASGDLPPTLEDLAGKHGLEKTYLRDGWGNPFFYKRIDGDTVMIYSRGSDVDFGQGGEFSTFMCKIVSGGGVSNGK